MDTRVLLSATFRPSEVQAGYFGERAIAIPISELLEMGANSPIMKVEPVWIAIEGDSANDQEAWYRACARAMTTDAWITEVGCRSLVFANRNVDADRFTDILKEEARNRGVQPVFAGNSEWLCCS